MSYSVGLTPTDNGQGARAEHDLGTVRNGGGHVVRHRDAADCAAWGITGCVKRNLAARKTDNAHRRRQAHNLAGVHFLVVVFFDTFFDLIKVAAWFDAFFFAHSNHLVDCGLAR
jgi:hypothetical protein